MFPYLKACETMWQNIHVYTITGLLVQKAQKKVKFYWISKTNSQKKQLISLEVCGNIWDKFR